MGKSAAKGRVMAVAKSKMANSGRSPASKAKALGRVAAVASRKMNRGL